MSEHITTPAFEDLTQPVQVQPDAVEKSDHTGRQIPLKPVAILAGAAVLIGGGLIAKNKYHTRNDKIATYKSQEASMIEAARINGKFTVLDGLVVIRGANFRATPDSIDGRFTIPGTDYDLLKGNVEQKIGEDKEQTTFVVRQPIVLTKPDGTAWIGFRLEGPELVKGDYKSSPQVAEDISWFNYSQLKSATDSKGEKLVQVTPLGTDDEVSSKMVKMTEQGQIVDNGVVGARGQLFSGTVVQDLMELQSRTS